MRSAKIHDTPKVKVLCTMVVQDGADENVDLSSTNNCFTEAYGPASQTQHRKRVKFAKDEINDALANTPKIDSILIMPVEESSMY